jgi:hypothetical protein
MKFLFAGKCLYLSGLVPEPLTADDDFSLLNYGIGFTNMVARPTKGSADLTRREIKQGSQILLEKLQKFRPKIAVFNGKLIYEVFSGKKDFPFGRQSEFVDGTNTVSSSPSSRLVLSYIFIIIYMGYLTVVSYCFLVHLGHAIIKCKVCTVTTSRGQSPILHGP